MFNYFESLKKQIAELEKFTQEPKQYFNTVASQQKEVFESIQKDLSELPKEFSAFVSTQTQANQKFVAELTTHFSKNSFDSKNLQKVISDFSKSHSDLYLSSLQKNVDKYVSFLSKVKSK